MRDEGCWMGAEQFFNFWQNCKTFAPNFDVVFRKIRGKFRETRTTLLQPCQRWTNPSPPPPILEVGGRGEE